MKKIYVFVLILFFTVLISPSFSQSNNSRNKDDDIFVKTVPIVKIYSHQLGYKILFLKSNLELGSIYVPIKWFEHAGGKGEIVWGNSPDYPYFSIFWRNGKFDYIRIYVKKDLSDSTWGVLNAGTGVEKKFDINEIKLDF